MAPKKKKQKRSLAPSQESSDEDWEEVDEDAQLEDMKVDVKKDVEIEFDLLEIVKKKKSKQSKMQEWLLMYFKRSHNKYKKRLHVEMHKVHLMCEMCICYQLNRVCNDAELQAVALSLLPISLIHITGKNVSTVNLTKFVKWIESDFFFEVKMKKLKNYPAQYLTEKSDSLSEMLQTKQVNRIINVVQIYLLFLRSLGLQVRLVSSLQPMSFKPPTEKQILEKERKVKLAMKKLAKYKELKALAFDKNMGSKMEVGDGIPQLDGANDEENTPVVIRRSSRNKGSLKTAKTLSQKLAEKKSEPSQKRKSVLKGQTINVCDYSDSDFEDKPPNKTSKYNFTSSGEEKSLSDEKIPVSSKLCLMKKRKQTVVDSINTKNGKATKRTKKSLPNRKSGKHKNNNGENNQGASVLKTKRKMSSLKKESNLKDESNSTQKVVKNPKVKKQTSVETFSKGKSKNESLYKEEKISEHTTGSKSDDSFVSKNSHTDSDSDFVEEKIFKTPIKKPTKSLNRASVTTKTMSKVFASSSVNKSQTSNRPVAKKISRSSAPKHESFLSDINHWIEVLIPNRGWTCVNCISGDINKPDLAETQATKPLAYVLAFDNDNCVKDVTARYAAGWLTTTRKLRIVYDDRNWWKNTLSPLKMKDASLDSEENQKLQSDLMAKPLPTSIGMFKDHPLFVLRRHLLKYESIYPPDAHHVGFIRGEEILPRSSVKTLHTRDKWLQVALSVKDGEEPYKMVSSWLLNKKLNRDPAALSQALFGEWQTEPYEPPSAINGKVPRNMYGNVDLYKPCMIPKGCVHMRLEGLSVIAKKLEIDIAGAMVGFEIHKGYNHPVIDGFVVCEEFEETLRIAWHEAKANSMERAKEELEKKVYHNWRKLIFGLLTMERVKDKHTKTEHNAVNNEPISSCSAWQTCHLEGAKKKKPGRKRRGKVIEKKTDYFPFEVEEL